MIIKTVTVAYSGTVENADTTDTAFLAVDWELDGGGARTGNVILRTTFLVGGEREQVSRTLPAAQLGAAKFIDALNAGKAALTTKLGL